MISSIVLITDLAMILLQISYSCILVQQIEAQSIRFCFEWHLFNVRLDTLPFPVCTYFDSALIGVGPRKNAVSRHGQSCHNSPSSGSGFVAIAQIARVYCT